LNLKSRDMSAECFKSFIRSAVLILILSK